MQVANRMRMLRLVNKISKYEVYSKRIGIEDVSQFRGKLIPQRECDENKVMNHQLVDGKEPKIIDKLSKIEQ